MSDELKDPCPGCFPGGTCDSATCGRKQSSELMAAYGVPLPLMTEDQARKIAEFQLHRKSMGESERKITRPAIEGKVLWASSLGMEPVSITVEEVPEAQAVDYEGRKVTRPRVVTAQFLESAGPLLLTVDGNPVPYMFDATTGIVTLTDEAAKPAPLHPLQRLSSQPNGFGQSLWRPWE